MKRLRDIGSESSMAPAAPLEEVKHNIDSITTTTSTKINTNTTAVVALEEIRAKLEQARMKKTAVEERLLRQKQQELVPSSPTPHTTKAPTPSTATLANQSQTTNIAGTPKPMATIQTRDVIATQKGINITRAQEAQVALDRARSKLQGALQNRDRALLQQRQKSLTSTSNPLDAALATPGNKNNNNNNATGVSSWNRKRRSPQQQYFPRQKQGRYNSNSGIAVHGNLPPISALSQSFSLRINDIPRTGPPNMVYYCNDPNMNYSPASCMGAQGGKEAIEALRRGSYWPFKGGENKTAGGGGGGTTSNKNHNNATSISLVQRKLQLQNELMALKEKLDMKSSQEPKQPTTTNATTTAAAKANGTKNGKTATKEGLERRKAEAQTVMDISYWKHFVSKQEYLLEQVTAKINSMNDTNNNSSQQQQQNQHHHHRRRPPKVPRGAANAYQECLHERHATNKAIAKVQHDLDIIEQRQKVVEEGIALSTQTLLKARQALHDERNTTAALGKKLAEPENHETQISTSTATTRTSAMTFAEATKRNRVPMKHESQMISSSKRTKTKTTASMTVEATK